MYCIYYQFRNTVGGLDSCQCKGNMAAKPEIIPVCQYSLTYLAAAIRE